MTKHTVGPWTVILDDTGGPFSGWPSVEAPEHIDASVVHRAGFKQEYWGDLSMRECIANAQLIAAAPDLLAALQEVVRISDREYQAWDLARAAINKATGERTMTDPAFLPCPFCGNQPTGIKSKGTSMLWRLYHRCPVVGFMEIGWRDTKKELTDTWNTRADVGIYTHTNDTENTN